MRVDEFDFDLPRELIAQHPARPRDAARLLHVGAGLSDLGISDLPGLLDAGDMLVFNDTRVIPSRLSGRRGDAAVEVTLHKETTDGWWAFARPARRLGPGDEISFAPGFSARLAEKRDGGEVRLQFGLDGPALMGKLAEHGIMPLPPYIKRPKGGAAEDRADYQTLFAARDGAVAAPTAGLHFTPALIDALAARAIGQAIVTLHVGAGTFLPVKADDTEDHVMHAEWGEIGDDTAAAINQAKRAGGRIVAVGSTALRLLEAAADAGGVLEPFTGETDIFMTPGYRFRIADAMLTNFHLPRSTLFMLVAAFAGLERMRAAYVHAISMRYRFFSYGDACFLERNDG
ncbi:MAG: tRNA preQ1(34) S-adenosylmethionine ribosyltransferase-isomerase QueA [Rhodospirillales bacterium]|nr:tRNA preQ1(34) S-adenosylmethionine ribosyltransferase-isomerase QueA [Rhodospirillaceae bacterium]MDP6426684.1 tRNA preQ1(34) S-adenosylmethionine ribosyltransferase-isomerase QueA [Rhodospirillales bacterium]MDP6840772.1 tRNA preQ1(34) S-adenosylmethionine ribosyltransferase-isomerase QueA [Rhodospirillales bacterium]